MTVGEKIQKYRKKLGLSQEELGQQLLVSRQTISLWEKDQTIPTIDNLIRLKEIFKVSVDEILDSEKESIDSEIEPSEVYQFKFTGNELNEVFKFQRKRVLRNALISSILTIALLVFFICTSAPSFLIGLFFGLLLVSSVSNIKLVRAYKKTQRKSLSKICESTYEYKLSESYFEVIIYRENESVRYFKYYYTDIEQIQQFNKWLLIQFSGQVFIMRKEELKKESILYLHLKNKPMKTVAENKSNIMKLVSIILFVASITSMFVGMALAGLITGPNGLLAENMWLFYLLTPIPIGSVVFSFIARSKGYRAKRNLIVGIIMTILLCVYGSLSFLIGNVYDHSDAPIIKAEQELEIEIPIHEQINTQDMTKGTQSTSRGYVYYVSDIYFNSTEVETFESQIENDDRWLSFIPNNLIGVTSSSSQYFVYDYVLIYNADTRELNALPQESGEYRFLNILYNTKDNQMRIVEYDIDYVK